MLGTIVLHISCTQLLILQRRIGSICKQKMGLPDDLELEEIEPGTNKNGFVGVVECGFTNTIEGWAGSVEQRYDPFWQIIHPIYGPSTTEKEDCLKRARVREAELLESMTNEGRDYHMWKVVHTSPGKRVVAGISRILIYPDDGIPAQQIEPVAAEWYRQGDSKLIAIELLTNCNRATAKWKGGRQVSKLFLYGHTVCTYKQTRKWKSVC